MKDNIRPTLNISRSNCTSPKIVCLLWVLRLCVLYYTKRILFAIAKFLVHFLGIYDGLDTAELPLQYLQAFSTRQIPPFASYPYQCNYTAEVFRRSSGARFRKEENNNLRVYVNCIYPSRAMYGGQAATKHRHSKQYVACFVGTS